MTRFVIHFPLKILELSSVFKIYIKIMSKINQKGEKNKTKKFFPKKRKNKLTLVFDENARREFLTGFHKRKLQRKNKAKEEFEKQLKAERKRIKTEAKEQYMKLLLAQKPLPEISDLLSEDIDMGTHAVSVTELSVSELARKNNWIGINEVQYQERESEEPDENVLGSENEQQLEGMEIEKKVNKKSSNDTIVAKNCKDIKRKIKQQATNNVKNSKIFKKKFTLEKIKNIKRKRKQERLSEKTKKRDKRSKHKNAKLKKIK